MMKKLLIVLSCICMSTFSFGQKDSLVKRPTVGIHFLYNDFITPQRIKADGLGNVISNRQWNSFDKMFAGIGLDYFQGLTRHIDAVGVINGSKVDYLLPNNTNYGSSELMLDGNIGTHFKLFSDRRIVNPYLITKVGYLWYKNLNGVNLIPGIGLQIKVYKGIYVNTTAEYRIPMSDCLSPQLYYSIGLATNLFKNKTPKALPTVVVPAPVAKAEPVVEKNVTKNILVHVNDEATLQPLQNVEVIIKNGLNSFSAITNENGEAEFKDIPNDNYDVSGRLNKIVSSEVKIKKEAFSTSGNQLQLSLTHNDPRFTLVGVTVDNKAKPIGGIAVTVSNNTQKSTDFVTSRATDGEFRAQLASNSDFVIVGKKANYISNIENLSTKGLNRNATLYVKLQLGIEEATKGKSIVLNNIFFATGKSDLNTETSKDLQKLVQFMQDNPNTKLEIQGHTDNVGALGMNMKLSQNRAQSVVNFLIENQIDKGRLISKGLGPIMPVASNFTPEGRSLNRRVEMKVLE